jgi:hypothetical protein
MPESFVRPASPAWTVLVENSSSVEEMREKMKAKLAADGFVLRQRGYEIGSDVLTNDAIAAVSAVVPSEAGVPSERRETCVRNIYPGSNDHYTIFGASEAELDSKEQAIRAMYSGKR